MTGGKVKDIRLKANMAIFAVCLMAWVSLGIGLAVPGYHMPATLETLFATLTGVVIGMLTNFTKGELDDVPNPASTTDVTTSVVTHTEPEKGELQ
jgi:hypothetical protein